METRTLNTPPPDVELGWARVPINYHLIFPSAGIGPKTGLLLWIVPWGMTPRDSYSRDKLMPYLANKADCVVVSVDYHGIFVKGRHKTDAPHNWAQAMHEQYGTPVVGDPTVIFRHLVDQGIKKVLNKPELALHVVVDQNHYLSWGLMPALDHIAVLGVLLNSLNINRQKLILFGSSYGGYIVTLILKLMPNTFSCAIENSGFSEVIPHEINHLEFGIFQRGTTDEGVEFPVIFPTPWTFKDQSSANFFKPSYIEIRNMLNVSHFIKTETPLYSYHSVKDRLAPYPLKSTYCSFRKSFGPTKLISVSDADVDGVLFKSTDHGMGVSLKALFDDVARQYGDMTRATIKTDFDLETELTFDCGDQFYKQKFYSEGGFSFNIHDA